jgi:hypothetical protein
MLLGLPISANISTVIAMGNRQHVPSLFVQDDWKVNRSLTLNLGLRYDYFSPIIEVNNRQSNFDYRTGTLVQAGQNGASDALTTADKANFSPRIGFAWTPTEKADMVIRGAYGIFYSGQEIRTAAPLQLAYNLPFFYGLMRDLLIEADSCEPAPRQMHAQFLHQFAFAADAIQVAVQQRAWAGSLSSNMLLLNLILLIDVTFSTPTPWFRQLDFDTWKIASGVGHRSGARMIA